MLGFERGSFAKAGVCPLSDRMCLVACFTTKCSRYYRRFSIDSVKGDCATIAVGEGRPSERKCGGQMISTTFTMNASFLRSAPCKVAKATTTHEWNLFTLSSAAQG